MKNIMIIFIFFSSLTFSKGYNVSPKEITESVRIVNTIIFGSENIEHYNKLIAGTISAETLYGKYKGKSPLGITQISPAGWGYINWKITYEDKFNLRMLGIEHSTIKLKDLTNNHLLAIAYCSLYYKYKLNGIVPNNLDEYAIAWKKYYNTSAGSGTIKEFKKKYLVYGEKYLNKY